MKNSKVEKTAVREEAVSRGRFYEEKKYWLEKLSGDIKIGGFPHDNPQVETAKGRSSTVLYDFSRGLLSRLSEVGNRSEIGIFIILLTGIVYLLHRYTGETDIIIGTPGLKTGDANTKGRGLLTLRISVNGEMTFKDLTMQVKEVLSQASEHMKFYPFRDIVELLNVPGRGKRGNRIFKTIVFFKNIHDERDLESFDPDTLFSFAREEERLEGKILYDADLFHEESIVLLGKYLLQYYEFALNDLQAGLSQIDIVPPEEKQRILYEFNDTSVLYPEKGVIHKIFESEVKKRPGRIALVFEDRHISFTELNRKANRLAGCLKEKGFKNGKFAGILFDHSLDPVIAILSVLKAGGACFLIDPGTPFNRIEYICSESRADLLVTEPGMVEKHDLSRLQPGCSLDIVTPDLLPGKTPGESFESPDAAGLTTDFAFLVFTSGSTGEPKGVILRHPSVSNHVFTKIKELELDESDLLCRNLNIGFVASIWQFLAPLFTGAKLHIYPDQVVSDPYRFFSRAASDRLTVVEVVPSVLTVYLDVLDAGKEKLHLNDLRFLVLTGEKVTPLLVNRFYEKYRVNLVNAYGQSECSDDTLHYRVPYDRETVRVPIGKPAGNTQVYVVGVGDRLQPVGVPGELCIAGVGLAAGYLNEPGLTAEKFIPLFEKNPTCVGERLAVVQQFPGTQSMAPLNPCPRGGLAEGKLLYKTGDLVRWLPDGNIEFLGRLDQQVKIRGFRIEPGEIEKHLSKHEKIKEVVIAAKGSEENRYLCAYIVTEKGEPGPPDAAELSEYLGRSLPGYMIPAHFIELAAIPLTPAGKTDLRALPLPETPGKKREYSEYRDDIEQKLTELWSEVLRIEKEKIDLSSNFFALGGHSLNSVILIAKLNEELDVEISLTEIFDLPALGQLVEHIRGKTRVDHVPIQLAEKKEYYALSPAQQRMFVLAQMEGVGTGYNVSQVVRLEGKVDRVILEEVCRKMIERHEGLRTSFTVMTDNPVQIVHEAADVAFEIEYHDAGIREKQNNRTVETQNLASQESRPVGDAYMHPEPTPPLRGTPPAEGISHPEIDRFIRPFDPHRAPLFRAGMIRTAAENHIFMMDMHHIVFDGTSSLVFVKEFMALYAGEDLPPLKIQYKDFSEWQNSSGKQQLIKKQEEYWLRQFNDEIPVLDLPIDFDRPDMQGFSGDTLDFLLDKQDTIGLNTLAFEENATLHMVLLAIFNVLLSRLGGSEDIIVGTPTAGRKHADLRNIIGMFVNTLAVRNFPRSGKTFREFLKELRGRTLDAFENQEYKFEELVEKVSVMRDAGRSPLFDVMFVLQNFEIQADDIPEVEIAGLRLLPYKYENKTAKFDLSCAAKEVGDELYLSFEYSTALFKKETVERFAEYFKRVVWEVIRNRDLPLSEIDILDEEEKRRILEDFNETGFEYPSDKKVHQLFSEQVVKTPDHTALIFKDQWLSYRELAGRSKQLAGVLAEKGVVPGAIVAILTERSLEMLIGIYAILESGAAYLPIDTEYPRKRVEFIMADSGTALLLSKKKYAGRFADRSNVIDLQTGSLYEDRDDEALPPGENYTAGDIAYVIYTSGSTGRAKGVMVEHRSVVNLLLFLDREYPLERPDVYLLKTSYIFDVSVTELFGWFPAGGKLAILKEGGEKDPDAILEEIRKQGITHINFVPSMFRVFVDMLTAAGAAGLKRLKYIFLAGEALKPGLVKDFLSLNLDIPLEDLFGPTEGTVYCSRYSLSAWDGEGDVLIGKPVQNAGLVILDRDCHLLPVGITGELCIAGAGVAGGYLNNPELTADRFASGMQGAFLKNRPLHPQKTFDEAHRPEFPSHGGVPRSGGVGLVQTSNFQLIYKTGDLARWLPDGNIQFLGRSDHQVKIRGFRVEPGEIENSLLEMDMVRDAVVVDSLDKEGSRFLTAYMVLKNEDSGAVSTAYDGAAVTKDVIEKIRSHLTGNLPGYMMPSYFVRLTEIPLNFSGKVDRAALPAPVIALYDTYTPPGTGIEKKLVEIWAEVLNADASSIGIEADFFELGGHSLKATILFSKIHKHFDIKIPLEEVFKRRTVSRLAGLIENSPQAKYTAVEPVEKKDYYPLSSAQERLYFLHRLEPGSLRYNVFQTIRFDVGLDREKVNRAFKELIRRHENFRTSFRVQFEKPVQRVAESVDFDIAYYEETKENALEITAGFIRPFDLNRAPLLRVGLIKTAYEHILIVDMHHIISDATSLQRLSEEFILLYREEELAPFRLQYRDYSEWQNSDRQKQSINKQEEYWLAEFAGGAPVLHLPADFARPAVQSAAGDIKRFLLNEVETRTIKHISRDFDVTVYMVILSIYSILLTKLSGREELVVGTPVAGRRHADIEQIIGLFVNALAIRNHPAGDKHFDEYVHEVKEKTLRAFENQEYQFEDLVNKIVVNRDLSRSPLFDVMFNMLNHTEYRGAGPHDNEEEEYLYPKVISKYDLLLTAVDFGPELYFNLEYCTKLFKPETIDRFILYFKRIIHELAADNRKKISEIDIIPEAEKHRLLAGLNDTGEEYPGTVMIHRLFEEQAEKKAAGTAVICKDRQLTYGELNSRAGRLARALEMKGVKPGELTGICLEPSIDLLTGMIAVLKAGGTCFLLDAGTPVNRVKDMYRDCCSSFLLTGSKLFETRDFGRLADAGRSPEILLLDRLSPDRAGASFESPAPGECDSDPAFIVFTSGSTGKPKGVILDHRGISNHVFTKIKELDLNHHDLFCQNLNVGFVAAIWQFIVPFVVGAGLRIYPGRVVADPYLFFKRAARDRITVVEVVPSMLTAYLELLAGGKERIDLPCLRLLVLTGEKVTPLLVNRFYETYDINLVNAYGQSECSDDTLHYRIPYNRETRNVPIGKPANNTQVYVLGKDNRLQPMGSPGELHISGHGVSPGYLNNPDFTDDRFLPHFLDPGKKLYRTGDLVRWCAGENLEFLGRVDNQLKIRGFRIEPGEIEELLLKHEGVKQVVVTGGGKGNNEFLCAYIVPREIDHAVSPELSDPDGLADYLSASLPGYMIPAHFITLEKMPVTLSGKVDRRALPAPGISQLESDYRPPANEVEKTLGRIFAEVLGKDKTGITPDTDFFKSGGHSLIAVNLISKIHKELAVELTIADIFKSSTLKQLVELIEGMKKTEYAGIKAVEKREYYALSSAQKRLYILGQMEGAGTGYNNFLPVMLEGELDRERLTGVFAAMIRRHESLRTSFELHGDQPVQRVHDNGAIEFHIEYNIGIREKQETDRMDLIHQIPGTVETQNLASQENRSVGDAYMRPEINVGAGFAPAHDSSVIDGQPQGLPLQPNRDSSNAVTGLMNRFIRPFDLSEAPLLRAGLLQVSETAHILMMDVHHIVSDGTSVSLFVKECMALYAGETLTPLRIQYKDFSCRQNSHNEQQVLKQQETYWLKQLGGEIPVLNLPTDYHRPVVQNFAGDAFDFVLDREVTAGLNALTLEEDITLHMLLSAVFNVLLSKLSGNEDIIIGTGTAGRRNDDLTNIIGMFVNTLTIRNFPAGDITFKEFLTRVKQGMLAAYENQEYQFEELVEKLAPARDTGRNPLFDVMFVLQNFAAIAGEIPRIEIPGLRLLHYKHKDKTSVFDLTLFGRELGGEIFFSFEFSTKLFKKETIETFAGYFKRIVDFVIKKPGAKLGDIEILLEAEKRQILFDFNDRVTGYPKRAVVHELFYRQAAAAPHRIALVYKEEQLTYGELNKRSNRSATELRLRGVDRDTIVGIMVERSPAMIAGILAILKAGGAYLPVDPDYPLTRTRLVIEDTNGDVWITQRKYREKLGPGNDILEIGSGEFFAGESCDLDILNGPADLAYVMYTSGSTGIPKATPALHRNVVRLVKHTNFVQFEKDDRLLQTGALDFDASTFEIWGPLLNGAALYLEDKANLLAADSMKSTIARSGISHMWLTSSFFNQLFDTDETLFSGFKTLMVGGEALSPPHINKFIGKYPGVDIVNGYGPTENVTFSATYRVQHEQTGSVPIGKPIANSTAYVLDKYGNIMPIGVTGELYVGGDGVSRGYLNNPVLTMEKFIGDPFGRGDFLYRTGDLAKWLPDGNLEFIGRVDTQVKIRGFRIEPGEAEARLLEHEAIKEAVVIVREKSGEKYLCAYIVSQRQLEDAELKAFLSETLPFFLIPAYFIRLDLIPLTQNGKVDVRNLPEPALGVGDTPVSPRDEKEEILVEIWSEILGIEKNRIGIDSDFFECGGHSLKAAVLVAKIHKELNVKVPLVEIFKAPTIRELAKYIAASKIDKYISIRPVEKKEYYPLSSAQKRLYVLQRLEPESTAYNISSVVSSAGDIDIDRLENTFREIAGRHESLRTYFQVITENPVQRTAADLNFEIRGYERAAAGAGEREADVNLLHKVGFIRPFDLSKAPLLRVGLIENGEDKSILMIDMHHIIADGISLSILEDEFNALYKGMTLSPFRLQYKDFSEWQNSPGPQEAIRQQESYWVESFSGELPVLNLPLDYPRPVRQSFDGAALHVVLSPEETKILKKISSEHDVTLHMTLLAIYMIFLARLSGQAEIIVGIPVFARRHADIERIIGMFVNTLAMRSYPAGKKTMADFLREIKHTTLSAYENQEYQFEELVEKIAPKRDTGRNPIFDVMFNFLDRAEYKGDGFDLAKEGAYSHIPRHVKFDLTLTAVDFLERIGFDFEYCCSLFRPASIERFIKYFRHIIACLTGNIDGKIAELEIIPAEEKQRILDKCNGSKTGFPVDQVLHELFDVQAAKTPGKTALISEDNQLTYRVVKERSDRLAAFLAERSPKQSRITGIMVERSLEMVIGIYGILKSGAAYLPIDPAYPIERIDYLLRDSSAAVLLTQHRFMAALNSKYDVIDLEDQGLYMKNSGTPAGRVSSSQDPAYVIYTSGSTGQPKGVLVEHKSINNTLFALQRKYPFTAPDVYLLKTSYVFDVSVAELFGWFVGEGRLAILEKEGEKEPLKMLRAIERFDISHINFIPSMFNVFLGLLGRAEIRKMSPLKYIFLAGEALYPAVVEKFRSINPGCSLENIYGPTEAGIYGSWYSLSGWDGDGNIPIGTPLYNVDLYVLDRYGSLQPIGIPGELYIAGAGLARGYLNQPELTAEKFDNNKSFLGVQGAIFQKSPLGFLYKTGDIVKMRPDGNIEFLGRIDSQVKIRGNRVELGEIENRLLDHENINEAVVLDREDNDGGKYLCAYIAADSEISLSRLREYLGESLPAYMIPAYFIRLDKIPMTAGGKIDRRYLSELEVREPGGEKEYLSPRNELEQCLVDIWQDVLGRKNISIMDNFFMLGGDSIKTIRIASKLRTAGYHIEMIDIFTNPTIAGLSKKLKKSARAPDQSAVTGVVPLTPIQADFFDSKKENPAHYNQAVLLVSREMFDEETVRVIFVKILEHHDALRMTFKRAGEMMIQTNNGVEQPLALQIYDFRGEAENEAAALLAEKADEIQAGIDLGKGPLMRLGLFKMGDGDRLLIVMHHLVIDGVSWRVLFEDMETLYRQYKNGDPLELPLKSDSFKLWSEKLHEYARSRQFLKEKTYWSALEALEVEPLPVDLAGSHRLADTESLSFSLSEKETEDLLTRVHHAFAAEIDDILLTALGLSLRDTFGNEMFLIALEGHGREAIIKDLDIGRTMGWFTSKYPVVLNMSFNYDLSRQIKEVKETLHQVPNKGTGYGILKYVTPVEKKEGLEFNLRPRLCFNYLGQFDADTAGRAFAVAKESPGDSIGLENQRDYELDVSGIAAGGKLTMSFSYSKNQYNTETIETLSHHFSKKLKHVIRYCTNKKEVERTPADFSYKELTNDYLDRLLARYPVEDIYRLSPMQEGMLFLSLYENDSTAYFEQLSYRLKGTLDIDKVHKSLDELMKRYDILRTVFIREELKQPVQLVLKDREIGFTYRDIRRSGDAGEKERFVREFKEKDRKLFFDLQQDVSMRVAILQIEAEEYEFTWSYHHILMDGWCIGILLNEFFEIYRSYLEGRPYSLPAVKQYGIYIDWLQGRDHDVSEAYWRKYLAGYSETASLPRVSSLIEEERNYINEEVLYTAGKESAEALQDLAGRNNVTLYTIIQAIWGILVGRYTGRKDVVFGTVVSGRPAEIEDIERMIGLFINTIPVRITFGEDTGFRELICRIQEKAVEIEPHHYLPLAKIQNVSALKSQLIDHIMVFENYPVQEVIEDSGSMRGNGEPGGAGFELTGIDIFEQTHYNLNLVIVPGGRIKAIFKFNSAAYDKSFIERMAGHFGCLLEQVVQNSDKHVTEYEIMTGEEKQALLDACNGAPAQHPENKMIHELFMDQAERSPGRISLSFGDRQLSYEELNRRSGLSARLLKSIGVEPGHIVAIMMEKSLEMPVGILGILKSGGAYLPIDPAYPEARITYMLNDSGVSTIFANRDAAGAKVNREIQTGTRPGETVYVEEIEKTEPCVSPAAPSDPEVPAYVIYTSGTTGKPKGAVINHRNLVSLLVNDRFMFDFGSSDVWTMFHSYCFDFSVWEMYGALLYGGKLIVIPGMISKDTEGFLNLLRCEQVTVLNQTPTAFYHLSHYELLADAKELRARYVIFGGEALNPAKLKDWQNRYPESRLINMFGITETTVHVTYKELTGADNEKGLSVVGNGLPSVNTYIMDGDHNILPVGVPGELCVGGPGVCRGYLDRPELTEAKFMENPYEAGEILYRSGDLARILGNGELEFLGRIDQQVKIRGYRVECGEIESRLIAHETVTEAVALPLEPVDREGEICLCAYLVCEPGLALSGLRDFLKESLPDYMVPSHFVRLAEMPVTSSGKIDRHALPDPVVEAEGECVAPAGRIEKKLVAIWSQVLDVEENVIGVNSDFIELGGHSLKAAVVQSLIRKEFKVNIPFRVLFEKCSIRKLAEYIKAENIVSFDAIRNTEKREYYELSSAQKRFYFLQLPDPGNTHLNCMMTSYLDKEEYSREKVEFILNEIINRHEGLRTSFRMVAGEPVQMIHENVNLHLDYREVVENEDETSRIADDFVRAFDLSQSPLFRVGMIETNHPYYILMIDMHHIITDAASFDIIKQDFSILAEDGELPPLRIRYRDYSTWQNSDSKKRSLIEQKEYWQEKLAGDLPELPLPTDFQRRKGFNFDGDHVYFEIVEKQAESLYKLAHSSHVTLFTVLLSCYTIFLAKLCDRDDIIVGMPIAGRQHADLEHIVGLTANIIALRNYPAPEKTFGDFLGELKENLLSAIENGEYQFEDLVNELMIERETGRNPVFDVMFVLQDNIPLGEQGPENEIYESPFRYESRTAKFDLMLIAVEMGEYLSFVFEYNATLFRRETVERFARYFKSIVSSVIERGEVKLKDIKIDYGLKDPEKVNPQIDFDL